MPKRKLKLGDLVKVIGYRPGKYPPKFKDKMGTEKLFKSLVGKQYRIQGFGRYGHIELWPKKLHFVWIEPDLVELAETANNKPRKNKRTKSGHK